MMRGQNTMSDERFEYGKDIPVNNAETSRMTDASRTDSASSDSVPGSGSNYGSSAGSGETAGYNYSGSAAFSGSAYGRSAATEEGTGYNYSDYRAASGRTDQQYNDCSAASGRRDRQYSGSGAPSGTAGHSYAGQSGSPDNSAGTGRYYSYSRTEQSGENFTSPTPPVPPRRGGGKKGRGPLAAILAVILIFVIGIGAVAMVSMRSKAGAASGSASSAQARIESSADSADKEKTADGSKEGVISTGNRISTVEEAMSESSLTDTTVADVAEKVMPSIVSVYNKFTEESEFFGRTYTQEGESAGSGIIIEQTDNELLLVTNNHVVAGADSLSVQFIDETNCEASLKGTDVSSDLAVISVPLDELSAETRKRIAIAELGDSDSLRIGEHAIAIGNALGYGQSLTVGYISALNREITSEDGITGTFIQTDAAINPGNSGGALLNSKGQVIGINSNKIGGDAIEGMGFAIPISKAIPIIDSLKTQESKTKVAEEDQGVLGILGITVTSDVASAYGMPVGAYVEEVIDGSGAAKSDLQQGDIITAINGQTITGMEDLQNQLVYYSAGEEVTLTVQHPGEGGKYEEREIKVTLSKRSSVSSSGESGRQQAPGRESGQQQEDSGIFSFPFGF